MDSYNLAFSRTIQKLFNQIKKGFAEGYTLQDFYSRIAENKYPTLRLRLITVGQNAGKLTLEQLCGERWEDHPDITPVKIAYPNIEPDASLLKKPNSYKDSDSRSFYPL